MADLHGRCEGFLKGLISKIDVERIKNYFSSTPLWKICLHGILFLFVILPLLLTAGIIGLSFLLIVAIPYTFMGIFKPSLVGQAEQKNAVFIFLGTSLGVSIFFVAGHISPSMDNRNIVSAGGYGAAATEQKNSANKARNPSISTDARSDELLIPDVDLPDVDYKPKLVSSTPPKRPTGISWHEFDNIFGADSRVSDLAKEEEWKTYKGSQVFWSGTVEEIQSGFFSGLTLNVKMKSSTLTFDLIVTLKAEEKGKAAKLAKGSTVKFSGILDSYGGAFLPTAIKEGTIEN